MSPLGLQKNKGYCQPRDFSLGFLLCILESNPRLIPINDAILPFNQRNLSISIRPNCMVITS